MLCKNAFLHHILLVQKCIFAKQNVTNAFDAKMHLMPKCILAYIFQRKMFSVHFPKENVQRCKNAFDAKMHLMPKCILATRTFYEVKCSASHFPLENVMLCKNAFDAKMHLMPKCILATRTFYEVKCSASHFPKENVMLCKNAFDAYILLVQKCIFAKQNVTNAFDAALTFCWCKNAFLQTKMLESGKMHLMQKCIFAYIFLWKMFSVHFPKENVQLCVAKMHFCIKCI